MKYMYMIEKEQELPYYQFPKFLLEMNLSQNARVIYMLLYDRGRLSRKNQWTDEDGFVYSVLPIAELSRRFGKCQSSVKSALKELDDAGLLIRRAWGVSKPKRLYIRIPEDIMVMGYCGYPGDMFLDPPLSTVDLEFPYTGRSAVQTLLSLPWEKSADFFLRETPYRIIERESTLVKQNHIDKQQLLA